MFVMARHRVPYPCLAPAYSSAADSRLSFKSISSPRSGHPNDMPGSTHAQSTYDLGVSPLLRWSAPTYDFSPNPGCADRPRPGRNDDGHSQRATQQGTGNGASGYQYSTAAGQAIEGGDMRSALDVRDNRGYCNPDGSFQLQFKQVPPRHSPRGTKLQSPSSLWGFRRVNPPLCANALTF